MKPTKLAIHGGPKAITTPPGNMFAWPIITKEDEAAVLKVATQAASPLKDDPGNPPHLGGWHFFTHQ